MQILKSPEIIVVDANPILSALIGGSASKIFWSSKINVFATAEFILEEVRRYLPKLAAKAGLETEIILMDLALLPLRIHSQSFYKEFLEIAEKLIGERDPKDIDLLALTLKLKAPLWTNDRDFEGTGVQFFPTARLLKLLSSI